MGQHGRVLLNQQLGVGAHRIDGVQKLDLRAVRGREGWVVRVREGWGVSPPSGAQVAAMWRFAGCSETP